MANTSVDQRPPPDDRRQALLAERFGADRALVRERFGERPPEPPRDPR